MHVCYFLSVDSKFKATCLAAHAVAIMNFEYEYICCSTEESESSLHVDEKWPFEHNESVSFCNFVSKQKQCEEELINASRVSLDLHLTVSIIYFLIDPQLFIGEYSFML